MSARYRARRRALELLFESEARNLPEAELVKLRENDEEYPLRPYAREIVDGVVTHRAQLDELISTYAHGWTLERMPRVDRAVLRIGLWEILYNDDVDDPVAIDEAVTLAKEYSTDDSPAFVNALLDRISKLKDTL